MRIFAYVAGVTLVGLGWIAVLLALLSVSPWLALGWVLALALALLGYLATSPTYWGDHGRRGPRARCTGRRAPDEPPPTGWTPWGRSWPWIDPGGPDDPSPR